MVWGSVFHDGNSILGDVGDVGPVPAEAMAYAMMGILMRDTTKEGVFRANDVFGGFALTGTSTPLTLSSGCGVVRGRIVYSTADTSITVTSPSTATRYDRLVLRYTVATNQVRHAVKSSAEGVTSYPALTQSAAVWEVPLWQWTITTGGVITPTSERYWAEPRVRIDDEMMEDYSIDHDAMDPVTNRLFVPPHWVGNITDASSILPTSGLGWLMPDNKDCAASTMICVPHNMEGTPTVEAIIYPLASGDCYGATTWRGGDVGEAYDKEAASTGYEVTAVTAAKWNACNGLAIPLGDITVGQIWLLSWERLGTNAADTVNNDIHFVGFRITFVGHC